MSKPRTLSICTGAGLWDRAFADAGFDIVPGCEISMDRRRVYGNWMTESSWHLCSDLGDLPLHVSGQRFDFITGCPPCQSRSKLRAMRRPKFPDLTPAVNALLDCVDCDTYLFENVAPIDIPDAKHIRLNAMHWPEYWRGQKYHQSRARWFTYSPNIEPPTPDVEGDVNELMAYSVVAGRIYGPKRGAVLMGWPEFAELDEPCKLLQECLADGVPHMLSSAWAVQVKLALSRELAA